MKSDNFDVKWGVETAKHGWVAVPTSLFFAQEKLGLSPLEFNVLLNLIMHWWDKKKLPYPAQAAMSHRIGVSVRTIQRTLDSLVDKKIIEKKPSSIHNPVFKGRNLYDLTPLVHLLSNFSQELKLKKTSE
ncbi:helix-turn-helix domain-containing protein [Acinetobacter kookii]|nr:helix-turn-helix domain-containing protein [Acinetobacter baumannii]